MRFIQIIFFFLPIFSFAEFNFKRDVKLMGSHFDISVTANTQNQADEYIDIAIDEIRRIERVISSWDKNSFTSKINKNAGLKAVEVPRELYYLIERTLKISKLTDGAFDISFAAVDKIWKFDGSVTQMPSKEIVKKSVSKVGYQYIRLDKSNHSVFLTKKGMKIGFGAIGKGYAADRAKQKLQKLGVKSGIINASGDMRVWGKQSNGDDWQVAIVNPFNKKKLFASFPINTGAVVTSGDYEKFITLNGERYAHIIDPRTGYPSKGILSVTVFAPVAELADALATSVFVMGVEVGLDRINQLKNVEAVVVDSKGQVLKSNNVELQNSNK